jgi:hypothetical protein
VEPDQFAMLCVIGLAVFGAVALILLAYVALVLVRAFVDWVRSGRWRRDLWP